MGLRIVLIQYEKLRPIRGMKLRSMNQMQHEWRLDHTNISMPWMNFSGRQYNLANLMRNGTGRMPD